MIATGNSGTLSVYINAATSAYYLFTLNLKNVRVPERYLCRVPQQQVTRGAGRGSAGLSQRGYLGTIANQHSSNGMALTEARNELGGEADPVMPRTK